MTGAKITIESKPAIDAVARIIAAAGNSGAVLKNIGEQLRESAIERIKNEVTPEGTPFAPLNPLYAQTKRGPGILRGQSGSLAQIVYQLAGDDEVEVGSNMVYAAIHQFGGTIKPKNGAALVFSMGGRTIHAKSVAVPARPFLGISKQDEAEILAIVEDFFAEALDTLG